MKKIHFAVLALMLLPNVAMAEMVTGIVTRVEGDKVTVLRSDTNEDVTIKIKEQAALQGLEAGQTVTLDANKGLFTGWSATSLSIGR